jgi:hypothetical protein
MKKTLPFLLAALIFSACGSPSTNREATTSTNANKPAEPAAAALTEADAVAKEKELWQQISKQNMEAFGAALADDQIYVTDDGVHDKASTIKSVTGFVPSDVTFSDWKFISAAKDVAVTTYKTVVKGTMNGQPLTGGPSYSSSVWVNRGGKWLAVFHQDSQVVQPPPAPAAKPAPKPSASPSASKAAASTPPSTTADAEANEKAVWAALNAKKSDVFASFLSPDFIEVEAYGVSDRAASVKQTEQFDFSKSSLSDWKTVKVSNDASIVTYVAHFPGQKPDTEYHSTLWVNRDGKWLAVLHHGTPKAPPAPPATATKSPVSPAAATKSPAVKK